MAESIEITGLREVQKKLYAYSQKLGDRVVYGALRAGAAVMRKSIMANVPVKTGKLRKGFKIARSKIHRGRLSTDMIGIYLALRKGKDAPYYGRFQNDGFKSRGGKAIPGKFFIQKSFESSKNDSLRVIVSNASAAADLLARKVGI